MEHTPEIRIPEEENNQGEMPGVVPGIEEVPQEPDKDKGKKQPDITPQERQKIIDKITEEEEEEEKHKKEVDDIIKKRDQHKQ